MATLFIRNVPAELHREILASAKKERRSKEKQALVLLERALTVRRMPDNTLAEARKIRERFKRTVSMEEILAATEAEH